MTATGVNQSRGVSASANAGVSKGDLVRLRAMRNSPVSQTPLYQRAKARAQASGLELAVASG